MSQQPPTRGGQPARHTNSNKTMWIVLAIVGVVLAVCLCLLVVYRNDLSSFVHQLTTHRSSVVSDVDDDIEEESDEPLDETSSVAADQDMSNLTPEQRRVLSNLMANMVQVQGGTFMMGATDEQIDEAADSEWPVHEVTLSSFRIGRYEVTQEEWHAVMGNNPSCFKGDTRPVEQVSWNDCQAFISKLNELTGKNFRLPTEAEWEFAARGGNHSRGFKYAGTTYDIDAYAWYEGNSNAQTHNVGQKSPNELGLYDMSGNVYEWCHDWRGDYQSSPQTNPQGPPSGSRRVDRGGSWGNAARNCRVSERARLAPTDRYSSLGLRLAL